MRKNLLPLVLTMFGLLVLGLVYVLVSGVGVNDPLFKKTGAEEFSDLPMGQTIIRRVAGQRAWLTRLSQQQRRQVISLNPLMVDAESGCAALAELCVLAAGTARRGIDLSYSQFAPPQLPSGTAWYGGFVDPTTGAVFDIFGRAYRLGRDSDPQTVKVLTLD